MRIVLPLLSSGNPVISRALCVLQEKVPAVRFVLAEGQDRTFLPDDLNIATREVGECDSVVDEMWYVRLLHKHLEYEVIRDYLKQTYFPVSPAFTDLVDDEPLTPDQNAVVQLMKDLQAVARQEHVQKILEDKRLEDKRDDEGAEEEKRFEGFEGLDEFASLRAITWTKELKQAFKHCLSPVVVDVDVLQLTKEAVKGVEYLSGAELARIHSRDKQTPDEYLTIQFSNFLDLHALGDLSETQRATLITAIDAGEADIYSVIQDIFSRSTEEQKPEVEYDLLEMLFQQWKPVYSASEEKYEACVLGAVGGQLRLVPKGEAKDIFIAMVAFFLTDPSRDSWALNDTLLAKGSGKDEQNANVLEFKELQNEISELNAAKKFQLMSRVYEVLDQQEADIYFYLKWPNEPIYKVCDLYTQFIVRHHPSIIERENQLPAVVIEPEVKSEEKSDQLIWDYPELAYDKLYQSCDKSKEGQREKFFRFLDMQASTGMNLYQARLLMLARALVAENPSFLGAAPDLSTHALRNKHRVYAAIKNYNDHSATLSNANKQAEILHDCAVAVLQELDDQPEYKPFLELFEKSSAPAKTSTTQMLRTLETFAGKQTDYKNYGSLTAVKVKGTVVAVALALGFGVVVSAATLCLAAVGLHAAILPVLSAVVTGYNSLIIAGAGAALGLAVWSVEKRFALSPAVKVAGFIFGALVMTAALIAATVLSHGALLPVAVKAFMPIFQWVVIGVTGALGLTGLAVGSKLGVALRSRTYDKVKSFFGSFGDPKPATVPARLPAPKTSGFFKLSEQRKEKLLADKVMNARMPGEATGWMDLLLSDHTTTTQLGISMKGLKAQMKEWINDEPVFKKIKAALLTDMASRKLDRVFIREMKNSQKLKLYCLNIVNGTRDDINLLALADVIAKQLSDAELTGFTDLLAAPPIQTIRDNFTAAKLAIRLAFPCEGGAVDESLQETQASFAP